MSACACADGDNAIHTLLYRFARVAQIDHIVKHKTAIRMHCSYNFGWGPQACNNDGYFMFDAGSHVIEQATVACMHNLVHRVRCDGLVRIYPGIFGERFLYLLQPVRERCLWSRVEGGKTANNTGLALRDYQFRPGDDKHRRAD